MCMSVTVRVLEHAHESLECQTIISWLFSLGSVLQLPPLKQTFHAEV